MQANSRGQSLSLLLALLILTGTLAGLVAVYRRFHVEMANRRVEIAVEWAEVSELAAVAQRPLQEVLQALKAQGVSTLLLAEETLDSLEQDGRITVSSDRSTVRKPGHEYRTIVTAHREEDHQRILQAMTMRLFDYDMDSRITSSVVPERTRVQFPSGPGEFGGKATPISYANLRTMGIGLPKDGIEAAKAADLRIAGRVANFAGVNANTAKNVLQDLHEQGATTVIFNGDEALGFRGVEKSVAELLRSPDSTRFKDATLPPIGLHFGAVEFGKQKGDAKIAALLAGDMVRVHSIQAAEMTQLDESEVIDRFARAARERNIRFCYVRLLPFAGDDPVAQNTQFLSKISKGLARGSALTGGGMAVGAARPFQEPGVSSLSFVLVALGVAAGVVWMLRTLCPLSTTTQVGLLLGLSLLCTGSVLVLGETGRKVVALLAGIAFPVLACLQTFPRASSSIPRPKSECVARSLHSLVIASLITSLGIIHVIGLLASRPFMTHTNQFLGIKAQHAIPLLIIAFVALIGGPATSGETWSQFRARTLERLRTAYNEPARFGLLLVGILALAAFLLLVVRTGNDAGVGVSGFEMKMRATLDRILPVRPRTKEFLIGHPAFVLGLLWWLRGRRHLAIPCLVIGSLGQVSLLNTFCHIHSPLLVSAWRGGLGLIIGAVLGLVAFYASELLWFRKTNEPDKSTDSSLWEKAVAADLT
jgi:hypothetical protein